MLNPYLKQKNLTKEDIVLEYAPMVKHVANRLAARLPANFLVDDLVQVGMIGLLESIDKYDSAKGTKFKTYAEFRVKGAMLDDLRSKDWIPRSVRDNCHKLESAYSELRSNNIDFPSDKQLAEKLELKPKELPTFLNKAKPIPLLSLEDLSGRVGDGDHVEILETMSDPKDVSQIDSMVGEETQKIVQQSIEKLPEKEKMVLSLYYNEELNLKEIGLILDITESRTSQIRTKAIAQLRSIMKEEIASNQQ
ncbi:MAG: RNA polymerase sigma factor FliA [Flavobacteriaceae bacterium]|nr:RNA polymerase sigma factor FliA [Flavobacteriaceae bacterium]